MKKSIVLLSLFFSLAVFIMMSCSNSAPSTPSAPTATITAVPTSTAVASPNVVGTITIPEDSAGKQYKIIIDNDADYTNGTTVDGGIMVGVCGAGTTIEFAMQAAAGTYYLCAFVDKDNSGLAAYDAGDYRGYYPSTVPPGAANLDVSGTGFVTANFSLDEELADLYITVVMPGDQTGVDYRVGIYSSIEWGEDAINSVISTCPAGTSFQTTISGVKEGNYYLMGMVDVNGNAGADGIADEGDYMGIKGASLTTMNIPVAPNISVNSSMSITLNLETCNPNVSGTIYMPAAATGSNYAVYYSTAPLGGGAGALGSMLGTITSATTAQNYSFFVPIKTNYYITGVVDNNSSGLTGGNPESGDYAGIYGVPTPIVIWDPLPYPAEPNAALPGTGKNIYMSEVPDFGIISGNIQLPAGQAQSGITYQVFVDDDLNFGNGAVNMILGSCGSTVSTPYSVTVQAGTYYVYAVVKTASGLQYPPVQGDYVGVRGASWPTTPSSPNVVVTNGDTTSAVNISMALAANNITGVITFPAAADLSDIILVLDSDMDGGNGGVLFMDINQIPASTGTSYGYGVLCLFPGSWYLYGMVDNDGSGLPGEPTSHDFTGAAGPLSVDPAVPALQDMIWTEVP